MADNGAGVYVYDGEDVVHFTALHDLRDEDTEGSSLHRAFSIAEDDDGTFWFGTVYSGIWRYEPSETDPIGKGTFTNYAGEQGCPSDVIWTIYKTRSGEISSFGGLMSYAPGMGLLMTIFLASLAGVPPLGVWIAKLQAFKTLLDAGIARVLDGETTLEEVTRVIHAG